MTMRALALALALALVALPVLAEETIAAVQVNGKTVDAAALLSPTEDGDLLLDATTWAAWGVTLPPSTPKGLVSARKLGIQVVFDGPSQSYRLTVPASLLPAQTFQRRASWTADVNAQPFGLFTNYDVAVNRNLYGDWLSSFGHDSRTRFFGGVLESTGQLNHTPNGFDYRRGQTTWNKDFITQGTTLQLGDGFTRPNNLAGSVDLLGVHWGTNRALRPGESFSPVPVIGGIADSRSQAELYVAGVKQQQQKLQPGPYELQAGTLRAGANNLQVVVRDDFGREQVVNQDFYLSPQNLPKGKTEWSMDAGLVRTSPSEDRYGSPAIVGQVKHGLSDDWTMGGQIQATQEAQNFTFSNQVSGMWGALGADVGMSRSEQGTGQAWSVGYSYRNPQWSVFANHMEKSKNYWDLTRDSTLEGTEGFRVVKSTSAGVGYTPRDNPQLQISAAINQAFLASGSKSERLSATARYNRGADSFGASLSYDLATHSPGAYLSWRHMLGNQSSVSAGVSRSTDGRMAEAVQVSGSTGVGSQRLQYTGGVANAEDGKTGFATLQGNTPMGRWQSNVTAQGGQIQGGGRFEGSAWVGEGGLLMGPASYGSFAIVEVPGQKDVPVGGMGGYLQKTNNQGYALVSNLQPLQSFPLRIDTRGLPMDTTIDRTSQPVAAVRLGGAKVVFPVSSTHLIEIHLQHNGQALAGTGLVKTSTEEVPLGLGGVAVLEHPEAHQTLTVTREASTCHVTLPETLPDFSTPLVLECL